MKKLVSVLFALLLVGSFAFAEVTVGAWGRFIYDVAAGASEDAIYGGENVVFSGPSWADGSRIGVDLGGKADNYGFQLQIFSNGNVLKTGDNARVWIKFNDMVTLQGGRIQGDVLRGKIDDSDTINNFPVAGKDSTFKRFNPQLGILLEVTPAEGVYVGAALDSKGTTPALAEDVYAAIQVGGGYVIPDVGHFRAQYIGGADTDDPVTGEENAVKAAKYINAAFAYTAMEGLVVDAGVYFNMEADTGKNKVQVNGSYSKDALSLIARLGVGFGEGPVEFKDPLTGVTLTGVDDTTVYGVSVDAAYVVAEPMSIGIEGGYDVPFEDSNQFFVLPYAKLSYGGGSFKAGFQYNSFSFGDGAAEWTTWQLPMVLTYGF